MPGERTEQATQHRREQARKEGDILHSRELSAAAGTLAGVMVLGALGPSVLIAWRGVFQGFLDLGTPAHWEPSTLAPTIAAMRRMTLNLLGPVAVMMATVAAAALGVGVAQTGGVNFHVGAIGFKPDRINPVSNIKNLFSLRAAARLAKSLFPAAILAVFAVQRIGRELGMPPFSLVRVETLGTDIYGLLLAAAWLLFAFGVTVAPFFEELTFRGFLLPALCTAVDWTVSLRTRKPPPPLGPNGHPQWSLAAMIVGSVLTSLPFAAMHADQTGYSLGPFVLLFCVSLILCFSRLATRSLAASTLVHAVYNFILFTLMLVGTSGFKHLDKM